MTEQLAFLQGYRYTWPDDTGIVARTILAGQQPMYTAISGNKAIKRPAYFWPKPGTALLRKQPIAQPPRT